MAFFSEFFFSTLIGKPVYTFDEKLYGRFRDFVVRRHDSHYIVTKVRLRTNKGERILIPWKHVHSLDSDPVSVKLKKNADEIISLDYDETELRLKRDFLDQQIVDTHDHRVVRVNDIKIIALKGDLFVVAADTGIRGLLRRIGFETIALGFLALFNKSLPNTLIPSKFIDPLPARLRHHIALNVAQDELKRMHPADLADIVTDLDQFERLSMLKTLPVETVANTIAELEPEVRKELVKTLKDETLSKVLERLSPDSATDIVSELPRRRMRRVLSAMKVGDANEIQELLKFKEDTAGSLMNTEYVAFPDDITAAAALEELRTKADQAEQIFYLYLVDSKNVISGVISLKDLIFVAPQTMLSSIVRRPPIVVDLEEDIDEVVEKFAKYNLIAIPVVDAHNTLLGVITVDDVLPLLQEQAE
ncbi:hypothetical protein CO046_01470 [Candidatus Peregrinibacteria bacterium CG_4_9_14_0_2_um_filter_53_11]|nr:MAG: hypothetical protein CO046_01470 [Candidatus Peregrinibacteria bacterium CG_4_9_14_0_2_um_filter_53_11]